MSKVIAKPKPTHSNNHLEKKLDLLLSRFSDLEVSTEGGNMTLLKLGEQLAEIKSQNRLILKNINAAEDQVSQQSLSKLKSMVRQLTKLGAE